MLSHSIFWLKCFLSLKCPNIDCVCFLYLKAYALKNAPGLKPLYGQPYVIFFSSSFFSTLKPTQLRSMSCHCAQQCATAHFSWKMPGVVLVLVGFTQ